MIKTHKITGQRFLLKKANASISTLFILDKNNNKIVDGRNCNFEIAYKMAICLNKNII